MTLLAKEPGVHDLNKIRPILLFEVIRKMWSGMVTTRVQKIWHSYGLLHSHQHGFRKVALLQRISHSGTFAGPLILCQSGSNDLPGLDLAFQLTTWNGSYVWMRQAVSSSAPHINKPISLELPI
jgi:hypothetical protein